MKKKIWLAVGASAGLIAAAGFAPVLARAGGPALRELWGSVQPSHFLWAAVILGATGAAPLLASRWPFRLLRGRPRSPSRARTQEQRLARMARRKGLSQDAVRILLWRDKERPARRRRARSSIRGSSFRSARSSAAPEPAAGAPRLERSAWVRVA
jgi:hypothetical protein